MVEVFKTNVNSLDAAKMLVRLLQRIFNHYEVNFDLDDCDKILRVKCEIHSVQASQVINVLSGLGFQAKVLEDTVPPTELRSMLKYHQQLN